MLKTAGLPNVDRWAMIGPSMKKKKRHSSGKTFFDRFKYLMISMSFKPFLWWPVGYHYSWHLRCFSIWGGPFLLAIDW